jgi:phenylacetate-CoA ligase
MHSQVLALYHCLPPSARSAAATLRGWYLNLWRNSGEREQLTQEVLERDTWSAAQWATWQQERIAYVLHRAATRVPFYRDQWDARRRAGDRASWELLENWPVLEKESVRANPKAFLGDDCDPRRMYKEQTSGTTGTPLTIYRSRTTVSTLYAIAHARTRAWDGIPEGARWARFGGQLVTPVQQRKPPFWVWNAAMKQLYMSGYHLAIDLMPHYLDALIKYRITYLSGYPSAIHALAQQALRLERRDLHMDAVYTNAEPLSAEQRRTISAAFHCPVRQTYGMAETVAAASECSATRLHQWPEAGHVEVSGDGDFVCTGLLNVDMPLVRYRVGDRGKLATEQTPCGCGRSLPVMSEIEGRADDLLITRDGRSAAAVDVVLDGIQWIREAQIVQEELDLIRVRIAAAPGFTAAHEHTITMGLRERMGEVRVIVDRVDAVPRTSNGKLRAIVCNLSPAERTAALGRGATVTT